MFCQTPLPPQWFNFSAHYPIRGNWPNSHQLPVCHWQHFRGISFRWVFFFFCPHKPGTVTIEKFPFIIITSVECPFIKHWMPGFYRGRSGQGDLLSNDCYKTLYLWDKWDDKGEKNNMANKPNLHLLCGDSHGLRRVTNRQTAKSRKSVKYISSSHALSTKCRRIPPVTYHI